MTLTTFPYSHRVSSLMTAQMDFSPFIEAAAKHSIHLEASPPSNKKRLVAKGKAMGASIRLITITGDVEVRYGMHMPAAAKAWRRRPGCFENVERHIVSAEGTLLFECGTFIGNAEEALEAFECLCRVFDL